METVKHYVESETIKTLWNNVKTREIKLAVLQDGSRMMEPTTMTAWQNGKFDKAIELIYQDTELEEFNLKTAKKVGEGVEIVRMHVIEEGSLLQSTPGYLDLLIEIYRRRNVALGKENIFLFPRSLCNGLPIPTTDVTVFDNKAALVTHYWKRAIRERDVYQASEPHDTSFVSQQIVLMESLLMRSDMAYRLAPVGRADNTTWRNTAGASWL